MIEWFGENKLFLAVAAAIFVAVVIRLVRHRKPQPRKMDHEFFEVLWLWPPGSHTRWEAEINTQAAGLADGVGLFAETTHEVVADEAPTAAEVDFCRRWLKDLDGLFDLSHAGLEKGWRDWFATEPPPDWRGQFKLEGFSVPKDGDARNRWEITWLCEPADHSFSVEMIDGKSSLSSIDG